ncbi:MAG: oligopeptidase B [Gammaproteobacteria bacterium]|jgi:oligopeptidase B
MPTPPIAKRQKVTLRMLGRDRIDDYVWLKDESWQQVMRDPGTLRADIRHYLEAENAYTDAMLSDTKASQDALFQEFRGRIKEDDSSVPAKDGPWQYYSRFREGGQHPIECRARNAEPDNEAILLDGDKEAEGLAYFTIGDCGHSNDHSLYAWTVDDKGSEFYTLRFKDLTTGELLDDVIEHCSAGFEWAGDNQHVFYTVLDDNHRPCKVFCHELGTPCGDDVLVYDEPDSGFFLGVGLTESRRFLVIDSHDHVTSEVRLVDAMQPLSKPMVVAPREPGIEYDVSHRGGKLIILTNADGAKDFKLVQTDVATPGREHWRDFIAYRPGVLIVGFEVYENWLVRLERENALPRIVVHDLATGDEHSIAFEEDAYALGMAGSFEFETDTMRFSYSSMTTPSQVFDYRMDSRERTLRKVQEVPSGHDPAHYRTQRVMATSHDGEQVPVSILYHQDTEIDGSAPVLLYGYGSYGHAIPASFSTTRLSLVDRGFIYAIAHIRGGMERGYAWYEDGKMEHKKNTFHDFIAAAEHLISEGFTGKANIVIHGGSAGGMLVGSCVNMRPDLFRAVIAEVPFVDVLSTMCDATLPLTPPEWPEWGNPIDSEQAYDYIASYSPYDNVQAQHYPHIIVTAGLTDPRVTYWEPAKWVAKLRASKTDKNLLLLHTNMEAGHGGAAGRFERLRETAMVYAFILKDEVLNS